jgi:PTS system cellobiose-specific IIA component
VKDLETIEEICFKIIMSVGEAKGHIVEAINAAEDNEFVLAEELMELGNQKFLVGHKEHAKLIQNEAAGQNVKFSLLLVHTEDQLMSVETLKIMAKKFIKLYRKLLEEDKL